MDLGCNQTTGEVMRAGSTAELSSIRQPHVFEYLVDFQALSSRPTGTHHSRSLATVIRLTIVAR